ncbi:MAG: HD domain-containing phosphohydrolase [Candidatus Brocadiales bacterium]
MKILIVEDRADDLYMLETILKGGGYEVISAKSGIEALDKLKKNTSNIIISDALMPGMDGFQLCRECKKNPGLREIPFIFYSAAYTSEKDIEFALSLGAEKCIAKPVEPEEFLKMLEEVIEKHRDGAFVPPKMPLKGETAYLTEYNERLVKKLEDKVMELEKEVATRKEVEEQLKQEVETTHKLLMISEATAQVTDIDRLMGRVVQCLQRIVGCDMSLSYLWDEETRSFRPTEAAGLAHKLIPFFKTKFLDIKTPFVKDAFDSGNLVTNTDNNQRNVHDSDTFSWIKNLHTLVLIPLMGKKTYLGFLVCVYREQDQKTFSGFTERERGLVHGVGHQVSIALEEARHYKDYICKTMELTHKIKTIQTMYEIDKSILSSLEPQKILDTVVCMTGRLVPCDGAMVLLLDKERGGVIYMSGFGIVVEEMEKFALVEDATVDEVIKTMRPMYIPDMAEVKERDTAGKHLIVIGCMSRLIVPLIAKDEGIGVLAVCAKHTSVFTPENLSTLEKHAAQISVALENARLVKDLNELFIGTTKSLSEAIDAKSPWTKGHSERVTRFAIEIGKEMGFDKLSLEDLELAGLFHDIGKIGIIEDILDKPRELTEEELRLVRNHPRKSAEILSPIKQLTKIIPAIQHHHEFYNGEGYPEGLKGEKIPMMARILGVADAVDAMGADRPYRKRMPLEEIIDELKRCSGTQFDPKVVAAFLEGISKNPESFML